MANQENGPTNQRESSRWGQQLQEATERVEQDLRRVVTYINDEVVPDIRRNGSEALRAAAAELQKLAQRMDERRTGAGPAAYPPKDGPKP